MNASLISVVIPTHNRPVFLKAAIQSILKQTIRDWEILVVDDQSDVETKEAVESFKDPRIRWIRTPVQSFASGTRNLGIEHASAELISFLDDDDMYYPEKLAQTLAAFSANPDVGVVVSPMDCGAYCVNANLNGNIYKKLTSFFHSVPTSSLAFRKSILEKLGGFDPTLTHAEDIDLCIRAARITNFLTLVDTLVFHRQHDGPRLVQSSDKALSCLQRMLEKNFPEFGGGINSEGRCLLNSFCAMDCSNRAKIALRAGTRCVAIGHALEALRHEPVAPKRIFHFLCYCVLPKAVLLRRMDRKNVSIRQ